MPTHSALDSVEDAVRRLGADLVELSHAIHAEPELAFAERRSCAKTQALVAERGFHVAKAPSRAGHRVPRRFRQRSAGRGRLRGVRRPARHRTRLCHNIIAASAVGTALALAEVADELGLTVALIGTQPRKPAAARRCCWRPKCSTPPP